ncbi:hypothetical protein EI94DRAFT_1096771 [Lactarius quietus]|nr:hypothetical protein EI94DRAFT_1096771 [Lactarius quietus]
MTPMDSETIASSVGQKDAETERIVSEFLTSAAPSQPCTKETSTCGLDCSPSILEPEFRGDHDDCANVGGHPVVPSTPCGADVTPAGRPPSDCPSAEAICVDGPPSFDGQISVVHSHAKDSSPGRVSVCNAECIPSDARGAELSHSTPPPTQEHPIDHSPQAGPACPSPSESAHPSVILPCQPATAPDPTPSSAVSVPSGRENFSLLRPPPEVAALLTAQRRGIVVSPVLARDSPLVPWELPSEIGYFWLGLFKISEVKVETRPRQSTTLKASTVHRTTWRFYLEWVAGGEDQLKGIETDEWTTDFMSPWWEPQHPQQPEQQPLFRPSQSSTPPIPESSSDITIKGPNPRYSPLLLPLSLFAPFSEMSTAAGIFPLGYYCTACGRINVQRFLRHRICDGGACSSRTDPDRETGWALSAFSTRDRKVMSATVVPEDKWALSTTDGQPTAFDDETRLFPYHLTVDDSGSSVVPNAGADGHSHTHSVYHVFNGNISLLQEDASLLFETLQRDVRIERSMGTSVFATPLIDSGNAATALGRNGRSIWDQQAALIDGALGRYCRELGPLKVSTLRVYAWSSYGKHVQMFCPRIRPLVLLCLGADIVLLSILSGPNAKVNGKSKKECLRVTMVHGDIVVLSGGQFKFSMIRTGMCMLLEAECI